MWKNICDVCKSREADESNRFRFRRRFKFIDYEFGMPFPHYKWEEICLCKDCMDKIFSINNQKESHFKAEDV